MKIFINLGLPKTSLLIYKQIFILIFQLITLDVTILKKLTNIHSLNNFVEYRIDPSEEKTVEEIIKILTSIIWTKKHFNFF